MGDLLAASRAYRQWAARIATVVVACFGVGGLAFIAFFDIYIGSVREESTVFFLTVGFLLLVLLVVGRAVAIGIVNARKRAAIARIARKHDVPADQLARKVGIRVLRVEP